MLAELYAGVVFHQRGVAGRVVRGKKRMGNLRVHHVRRAQIEMMRHHLEVLGNGVHDLGLRRCHQQCFQRFEVARHLRVHQSHAVLAGQLVERRDGMERPHPHELGIHAHRVAKPGHALGKRCVVGG